MAQDVFAFEVLVPAGTLKTAGWSQPLTMPPRIVREVEIRVPPGPRGELGFALGAAGTPIIPSQAGHWIVSDDDELNWRLDGYLSSGAWQVFAYNTGTFPHTLYVRFLCDLVQAPAADTSLPDLTGVTGAALPPLPTLPPPLNVPPPDTLPPPITFPPLPPVPPVVIPPLPPITIPPLPPLGGPPAPGTPPVYPRALEPFFAAHVIAALVFGRGVGIGTVQQIAADVGQLGEQRALTKWASVAAHGGEITLLERVPNLKTDHLHPAQHVHNAKQIA